MLPRAHVHNQDFYRMVYWRKSHSSYLLEYDENFADLFLLFAICSDMVCKYSKNPNLKGSFQSQHDSYLYDGTNSIFYWTAFCILNRSILEFVVSLTDSGWNI